MIQVLEVGTHAILGEYIKKQCMCLKLFPHPAKKLVDLFQCDDLYMGHLDFARIVKHSWIIQSCEIFPQVLHEVLHEVVYELEWDLVPNKTWSQTDTYVGVHWSFFLQVLLETSQVINICYVPCHFVDFVVW